jgi:hypothetical protein
MDFFRRPFFRGNSIVSAGPLTEIDEFAALAAKRAVSVSGVFGFFVARRTFHIRVIGVACG